MKKIKLSNAEVKVTLNAIRNIFDVGATKTVIQITDDILAYMAASYGFTEDQSYDILDGYTDLKMIYTALAYQHNLYKHHKISLDAFRRVCKSRYFSDEEIGVDNGEV